MQNFTFSSPTRIVFGRGVEELAGAETAVLSRRILLVYGGGSVVRSGLLGRVKDSLSAAGVEFVELGGVQPNPRLSLVREGIRLCRDNGLGFILAVGGGSAIDTAKAVAFGVPYEGDVWDFFEYTAAPESALSVGVVLTIPAAGSESSPSTVISNEERALKRGVTTDLAKPKFALLNPELTFTLPAWQTACGCADIMAHVMERYFTNERHVEVTDRMCEAVLKSIVSNLPIVLREPDNYDARAEIMWAGTVAHNDILGAGRTGDWASHGIEHELSALYDVAHGAGLAVVFPAWMKYVWKHDPERFVQFANRVWNVDIDHFSPERTILEGIARLERFFTDSGLPVRLGGLNIPADRIGEMAGKAVVKGGGFTGQFVRLDKAAVAEIYRLAL